jgi:hypothetical protein
MIGAGLASSPKPVPGTRPEGLYGTNVRFGRLTARFSQLTSPATASRGGGRTQDAFGATLCRLPGRFAGSDADGGVLYSTPGSPPLATPRTLCEQPPVGPEAALGLRGPSSYDQRGSARQEEKRTPPSEPWPELWRLDCERCSASRRPSSVSLWSTKLMALAIARWPACSAMRRCISWAILR